MKFRLVCRQATPVVPDPIKQEQKRRLEADVIMDAYLKSGKSLEEIMTFLKP